MDYAGLIRTQHDELRAFYERAVQRIVPPERMTERPGDIGNSIAWIVWHLARAEDVVINAIVRDVPQVLDSGGWAARMGVADHRIGTGFEESEVEALSRAIDVVALDDYWQAVRGGTDAWLPTVPAAAFDAVPDVRGRLAAIAPVAPPKALEGLIAFWQGRPAAFLVRFPLINHGFLHLGEMFAIRGRLGLKGF
jgi:DinB family protein